MSSGEEEAQGSKKRKAEEEATSSASGVPGIETTDGIAWDLGGDKLLRVKTFKGRTLVDIREFYEDKSSGEKKPGKKGISLNVGQWEKLVESIEQIKQSVADA